MAIVLPKEFQIESVLESCQEQEIGLGVSMKTECSYPLSAVCAASRRSFELGSYVHKSNILSTRTWTWKLKLKKNVFNASSSCSNGWETVLRERVHFSANSSAGGQNIVTLVPQNNFGFRWFGNFFDMNSSESHKRLWDLLFIFVIYYLFDYLTIYSKHFNESHLYISCDVL